MSDVITFESDIADDDAGHEPGLFDDDDPFNLPPPLPPLSPGRDDDPANQDGDGDQTAGESNKKEPVKKRKVNRSPRPKLDEVRLCSDRGIPALQHLCDGIKFKGKGHEASDLKLLMQRYEHWAHRLFPKFPFVDVVEQVEKLSSKKLVQNCIKRIRRGEEEAVNDDERSDTELGDNNGTQDDGTPSQDGVTPLVNNLETFGAQVEARDRMVVMTSEQQERMRRNREIALAKRKAAQEKQAELDNSQTRQTDAHNQSEEVAAEGAGNAQDDHDTMENLAFENNPSVQANDVEMGDATVDRNTMSLEDGNEESGTVADALNSSLLAATNNSHADGEDAEMNTEGNDLVADTVTAQSGSSVHNIDNGNPDGTATDNNLFDSTKELPRHEDDDLDLCAVQAMDKAHLSSYRSFDESTSEVLNHEVHQQEGCKGTLDTQPLEQAPDENGHEEPQSIEVETE